MTKIEIEYLFNCSPKILFNRLSTPIGLAEWFADEVIVDDNIFTFVWEGIEEKAELIAIKELNFVRFKWLEAEEDTYFEFRIITHELTNDVALIVTDFAIDNENEEVKELWETQINKLKYLLGA
ncbi:MAG: START-like domain-containing protein [Bacteroidales bacterium]|jgi:uncharacterized protein YndB with AHSA1/START domain|nr:START-like domain-containing protein [Bacteroidales bacterium]HOL97014.1 START-like domain-containing protein [Bacteroidales bacterium]HOM36269.1 START-like domain-containing protein [Bacteroidales bacterium]HPD23807.1 START-like domain-containing protein [Bacteroidales bacterium]HRS98699.1 START-like domain-containing protein [Bacteroidales bacterium]